jgi:hypothetical protein
MDWCGYVVPGSPYPPCSLPKGHFAPHKDISDRCTCGHVRGDHARFFGLPGNACEVYGCMCPEFTPAGDPA